MKNISIIIITDDDNLVLRDNLPGMLRQDYNSQYEIVVVRNTRRGEMTDLLEPFMQQHKNLHSTFLPDKPQYITDEEVEILLGAKAAQYDNIIVVPPDFNTGDDKWLERLAEDMDITNGEQHCLLNDARPILFGDAHLHGRFGFFKRRRHLKTVKKALKKWCKEKDISRKELFAGKNTRHNLAIAFRKQDYMNDMTLRHIIQTHLITF